jgi:hypothetical protein
METIVESGVLYRTETVVSPPRRGAHVRWAIGLRARGTTMLTFGNTLARRSPAVLAVTAAVAALVVASPVTAAPGRSPSGLVYNYHGEIRDALADLPTVTGWAFDPDKLSTAISVRADVSWTKQVCSKLFGCMTYVVSRTSLTGTAGLPDSSLVGSVEGPDHGFGFTLPLASIPIGTYNGEHVCVTAVNVTGTGGADTLLGCYPVVPHQLVP